MVALWLSTLRLYDGAVLLRTVFLLWVLAPGPAGALQQPIQVLPVFFVPKGEVQPTETQIRTPTRSRARRKSGGAMPFPGPRGSGPGEGVPRHAE
jgi:hypothetical protein